MNNKNPLDRLKRARRGFEEISELEILDDWSWDDTTKCFHIHVRIDIGDGYPSIPNSTEWYITAETVYPSGRVRIYPSVENSITNTYSHQANNASIAKNGLWRQGDLCVNLISLSLGNRAFEKEPFRIDERLCWYARRTVLWLKAAGRNELAPQGNIFELPSFEHSVKSECDVFAFHEDLVSMIQWEDTAHQFGLAKVFYKDLAKNKKAILAYSFMDIQGKESICIPKWGSSFQHDPDKGALLNALWVKIPSAPVLNNWQPPSTLGELKKVCSSFEIDIMKALQAFGHYARDGHRHMLMIGFPVSKHIGEEPVQMIWQGLFLPELSSGKFTSRSFQSGKKKNWKNDYSYKGAAPGYRANEAGWWANDCSTILKDNMKLEWQLSQNWNSSSISERGRFSDVILRKSYVIIGAGSLGSAISELLVRAGINRLTCVDDDVVDIGNLCRHTLTTHDLHEHKSHAVANRLSYINPCANIEESVNCLAYDEKGELNLDLNKYDVIIDTTGEDIVLELLSSGKFKHPKVFCSVSVGLGAKRMYLALIKSIKPDFSHFAEMAAKHFECDWEGYDIDSLPREGIGCWHPLFPARSDDIWLAACTAVKSLESFIGSSESTELLVVFKQETRSGIYAGFSPIEVLNGT